MSSEYSVIELCEALGVSPSGYFAARSRGPSLRSRSNHRLLIEMTELFSPLHGDFRLG